jgi:hypothetical protein
MSCKKTETFKTVVIILTMNQRDKTLQGLSSLMAVKEPPFDVLLWDNGSQDGTPEAVHKAFPEVLVHHHSSNLGVASGRNAAAELAIKTFNPSHLLFLDNDMLVEPNFVNALLQPFSKNDRVGQTQAKLRFMYDRERLNDGGGCQINFLLGRTKPVGYGEIDRGQHDAVKKCVACGGAMMVRTDLFQQLGGFDASFDPFGPEDLDFSLRLTKAGYDALYVPQAVAYHEVSHTFGEGYSDKYARLKSRHWFLFMKRHARFWEKIIFMAITAPWLFLRIMIRELRNKKFSSIRGLISGLWDFGRAQLRSGFQHD